MNNELVSEPQELALPAELTEVSLTLAPGTSFDEWLGLMRTLSRIDRAHQWWEGDALNQGDSAYGEKYAQAVEEGREDAAKAYAWSRAELKLLRA